MSIWSLQNKAATEPLPVHDDDVSTRYPRGTVVHPRRQRHEDSSPGKVVGYRDCRCGAMCLAVRWPDSTLTWPCLQEMKQRSDGSLQIL